MKVPSPSLPPGQVQLTINAAQHPIQFNLNVLRDFTRLTGRGPSELGPMLAENYAETLTALLTCAVRRFVPGAADFSQDDAGDLIQQLPVAEAKALAEAITEAIIAPDPLMAALTATVAARSTSRQTPSVNGTSISTSASAN